MTNPFQDRQIQIDDNKYIRIPQREAFQSLVDFASEDPDGNREAGIILPVGCGKSGCITLTPFAFGARRTLVVAPGLAIAQQLEKGFDPANEEMFYRKCKVLDGAPYPEPAYIRGDEVNLADLQEAHVVITNIQQLQGGEENRWLKKLPSDFFDLILFDEGHHSVAESWTALKTKFPHANIVNFSATPLRADGQIMAGRVIYSYPIFRAIAAGYVKKLKAVQLNPRTLRYVRREDNKEIDVSLDEVRRLGEDDADFRRSIVTSRETLGTIVDASIQELKRLRDETNESRLKIIASALNYEHCAQVVAAYRERGLKADFVHSIEGGPANDRVMNKLARHQIDVIVQVRKLGEGFDHPYLAVAAVLSIFSNLSPFVQFVGRVMRVIKQDAPGDPVNHGVVVFHAGANIARRWEDFRSFTEADQSYFDQLLPIEDFDPADSRGQKEFNPVPDAPEAESGYPADVEIRAQSDVSLEEIPLLKNTTAAEALRVLKAEGFTVDQIAVAFRALESTPTTKVRARQAKRAQLDARVMNTAARLLAERKINPQGRELDKQRLKRTNLVVLKSAIDKKINAAVDRGTGQRGELSRIELERIESQFEDLVAAAINEVFNGPS
ncbi:DEAD/DEAH box helicase [Corallococcus exiguus]|uniref:DEAD/DEAH box helicase family protein n=1 Tax=Corallococcus exiguus TaxID=83462 RepID=A0A7X5BVL4_9BACT|nr:DEAD/DEAH box helicase family protein [Corallococcus exiguus]NBC45555.1 DEAD/DEAH box helicase family protein [Corallococcus exiguus]TNV60399.1 DEAD/DEAH box helicase [Corallococcus exiguus]